MTLPVDYSSHDGVYRALRARGANGWSGDDEYAEMFGFVAPGLPPASHDNPARVLELGCGAGNLSLLLADRGYAVTGVDISEAAVAWARERARGKRAAFRVDDVVELASCEDASFDAVVDGHCLHCIIGDDRARCLESVHRVLKPGGVFIVMTMCGAVLGEALKRSFDPLSQVVAVDGRPTRYIGSAEAITAEVEHAGFEIALARVEARKSTDQQDDLIIYARKRGTASHDFPPRSASPWHARRLPRR